MITVDRIIVINVLTAGEETPTNTLKIHYYKKRTHAVTKRKG
ncbi:MAG: polymorphic toxin type 50 domain-containing protein [Clostridia bacterium]